MDYYAWTRTELMCYKCIAKAGLGVLALNQLGMVTPGVALSDPMSFVKPFGVLFGVAIVTDFLFMSMAPSAPAATK